MLVLKTHSMLFVVKVLSSTRHVKPYFYTRYEYIIFKDLYHNHHHLTNYNTGISFWQHILNTEENWNGWKNEGCPSFVKERYLILMTQHFFIMLTSPVYPELVWGGSQSDLLVSSLTGQSMTNPKGPPGKDKLQKTSLEKGLTARSSWESKQSYTRMGFWIENPRFESCYPAKMFLNILVVKLFQYCSVQTTQGGK